MTGSTWRALALLSAACSAGCSGSRSASPPVGARLGPAVVAALAAADHAREPWRCAAFDGPSPAPETLTLGNRTWRIGDRTLILEATGDVTIGVIADAAGSAPATLAALGRLRAQLDHVDLVLSLGGMGANRAELDAVFTALADQASWPLVAMPGDLEPVEAQAEAIAMARQRGTPVVDGRQIQRVALPQATIALIPGAGAASRLVAGADGCSYRDADVAAALADLTPRPGLRILASSEPPRGGSKDEPTGELSLVAGAGEQLDLALHGPTSAAASPVRSGGRDGVAVALTPGSSDAVPRLDGPPVPTAGVLAMRGTTWSWTPITGSK